MPKLDNRVPKYSKHKASGQAVVTLNGKDVYLGPWNSAESRTAYDKAISEWTARSRMPLPSPQGGITVVELAAGYFDWCKERYKRHDGKATTEVNAKKCAVRPLLDLYGTESASQFGPKKLKAVRERMIELGWCRNTVNAQISWVKRVFRWAVGEESLPESIWNALRAVTGLEDGQARESAVVTEISEELVDATIAHLPAVVAAMVKTQLLAGMRPGEVCSMRAMDIDMTKDVWVYRPPHHKLSHKKDKQGKPLFPRNISIGPEAQPIITPFLTADPQRFIFPSDDSGKDAYGQDSYRRAIQRACERAFSPPAHLVRKLITPTGRKKKPRLETRAEWWNRLNEKERAEVDAWMAHRIGERRGRRVVF